MRHLIMPLLAAAASLLSTAPAYADLGDQVFKLLPDDGEAGESFGWSVAISGATAIVGARFDDENGSFSGSAYLFDTTTGERIAKILPDDGAEVAIFGWSVAISGATAIVGAVGDDDNGTKSGSAYLFDVSDPANPTQIAKLLPDDGAADDFFGNSVAITGTTAIVGAVADDENGSFSGSAYLFNTTRGQQLFKLLADDGAVADNFGGSVAISGTTAIVGAARNDGHGAAYLFDVTTGRQLFKLLADDGAAGDFFGSSVAINAAIAIAIVGAFGDDDNGSFSGSAYLFDISDLANPTQIAKLLPHDGAEDDRFGTSVAISGATVVVGAFGDDDNGDNSGSAYLFDTTTGLQIAKLLADDGAADDFFGWSIAISGATAIAGAYRDEDNGPFSGSAYLFDAASCPWDLDDNAVVGVSDLLLLLADWGSCKGCPADFDGDGSVGVSDLLALLANWGPCP